MGKTTATHQKVLDVFLKHPDKRYRMTHVAKLFPEFSAETIRVHIRGLHSQGAIQKVSDFEYVLAPSYKELAHQQTLQEKRETIGEWLRDGKSRLSVVPASKEAGPYAPVSGTSSNPTQEATPAVARQTLTASTNAELLKRHLSSVKARMEASAAFTKADIEMLEELELMGGL